MSEHPELFPDGLDQKIFTPAYLPEMAFPLTDPRMAEIKLGQLLSFSAGIRGNNPVYVMRKPSKIDPVGTGWLVFDGRQFFAGVKDGQDGKYSFFYKNTLV